MALATSSSAWAFNVAISNSISIKMNRRRASCKPPGICENLFYEKREHYDSCKTRFFVPPYAAPCFSSGKGKRRTASRNAARRLATLEPLPFGRRSGQVCGRTSSPGRCARCRQRFGSWALQRIDPLLFVSFVLIALLRRPRVRWRPLTFTISEEIYLPIFFDGVGEFP